MLATRWCFAARYASRHLLISLLIALASAAVVFGLWYPAPYRAMLGVGAIFGLVLAVDVGKMGSDHDFRLHSSYGRGLARDQAFVAKRRLIAGEPARAALCEDFR